MGMKHILAELWRSRDVQSWVVFGGLLVNLILCLLLFSVMLPGLNKDRADLIRKQANMRGLGEHDPNQQVSRMSAQLDVFYGRVAAYENFPDFIRQLYQYAGDSGFNINRINYQPGKTDLPTVLKYELDFSVTGQYRQIKTFLEALENWTQLVVVEEVQLAARQPERDAVELRIRLVAYFKTVSS